MLKAVVDSLESIPEALREHYTKTDDGKFRLAAEGVEDVTGLKSALKNERRIREDAEKSAREAKELAERTAREFEGMDVSQIKALLEKLGTDEEAKLIKEGKLDQVIERRTEKQRKNFESQIKAITDKAEKDLGEMKTARDQYSQRVLDNHIREAATKVGLHPQAVDDALFRGRTQFSLDEEGNAVQLKEGAVVFGKDGRSPFSPQEWLEAMRESAPHWFPATASGAGTPPSKTAVAAGGKKLTRAQFDAMQPVDKTNFMREKGQVVDA